MKKNFTRQRTYTLLLRGLMLPFFLVFSIVSFAAVFPTSGQGALQRKITLNVENENIKHVLRRIEKTTSVRFVYQPQVVHTNRKVSLAVEETTIASVLNRLFDQGIVYEEMGDLVVIKPGGKATYEVSVGGRVTDVQTGEPLPGVNVVVKGTTRGTSTDIDGKYSLTVDDSEAVLVFSYVGYLSQEVTVGAQTGIDIQLATDEKQLEELVVVGYGTQKKGNLTGAVTSVSAEAINRRPVTNPVAMLQGQVSGLQIVQGTGQPGNEGLTVQIRGQGTYSGAGSNPLVLIDGAPGSLSNLNPVDIETISVLKDAASAAIYGARAANGVILVTTKTGKADSFNIEFNTNVAIHTPSRMLEVVSTSADYMRLFNEAKRNSRIASPATTYSDDMIKQYETATDRVKYPNFDWVDYMFNPATVSISSLSLNGGTKGTTYNMSLGYTKQPGVMRGFNFDKFNFRSNIKSDVKKWATVGSNISLERGNRNEPRSGGTDAFLSTLAQAPTYGPVLPDGSGFTSKAYQHESNNKNIPAIIANKALKTTLNYDLFTQLWTELRLFEGFSWYTKGSLNYQSSGYKDWKPVVQLYNYHTGLPTNELDTGGKGLISQKENTLYTNFYSYFKYDYELNNTHEFSLQAGYSQEYNRYEYLEGSRQQYATNGLYELDAGSQSVQIAKGSANEWAIQSLFGRFNYNYKDRYLFEANARLDGTSRISQDSRWGAFPSFSAAWRISQEDFFKKASIDWLNDLKIRASYGKLGNQNIANEKGDPLYYPYQSLLSFTGAYPYDNTNLILGTAQTGFANSDIRWETTTLTDVGLEFRLLKGLNVVYDYYVRNTTDILRNAQATASLGLLPPVINSGSMENRGHEITISYDHQVGEGVVKGLSYNGRFYMDIFKNEVTKFGARELSSNRIRKEGLPYNSFYMMDWIGVFQTQEEIDNSPKQFSSTVVPGDLKYRDENGDDVVNNDDRVVIPGRFPKFNYAFNAGASWKGFDISLFFQGVQGRKIFVDGWGYDSFRQGSVPTLEWLDRWTGPGTSNTLPRVYFDNQGNQNNRVPNSWYLQNASYLRLKNITFGYTLPAKLISKIKAEKLRIYFSADNLLTFTKYKYLDPERTGDGAFVAYPQNKVVSLGLNLSY